MVHFCNYDARFSKKNNAKLILIGRSSKKHTTRQTGDKKIRRNVK